MFAGPEPVSTNERLKRYRDEVVSELEQDVLPFWLEHAVDRERGGFVGRIAEGHVVDHDAPKGSVLGARLLWSFSRAFRRAPRPGLEEMARRAYAFLHDHFVDPEHGGVYWTVDARGAPLETKKQTYAQAFAVYALAEYHAAFRAEDGLDLARALFRRLEAEARDPVHGGYLDARARDWSPLGDMRLGQGDMNAPKTMNTHLQVLSGYAALHAQWPDPALTRALEETLDLVCGSIVDRHRGHFVLFFDERWRPLSARVSYGHDVEGGWLLVEAAARLGEARARAVRPIAVELARGALEGLGADGGLFGAGGPGGPERSGRDWWTQAEAMVGFLGAYEITGETAFLEASLGAWEFVKRHLLDRRFGEWHAGVDEQGRVRMQEDQVGPWTCPCHTVRACIEVAERVERLLGRTA